MLRNTSFENVYESGYGDGETLVERFYRPLLREVRWYDRIAGYLSLQSLANALEGVDELLNKDCKIRVIAGSELYESDKDILFPDENAPLPPRVKSQLAIIATLLEDDKLEIKVATTSGSDGIFHAKLGIGIDSFQNKITFEGSVNETVSAWERNFERFKVHRHWKDGEEKYVYEDIESFESMWEDNHDAVNVHPLPEAEKQGLIDWKDYGGDIEDHVQTVKETTPTTPVSQDTVSELLRCAGHTPGGIHLPEDIATIHPWPHQRTISDTAHSIYPENLLFCDEVGLGKTIEAGLTVSRLLHTGKANTALFLTPAGLMEQWQEELLSLFNIHAYRVDNRHDGMYLVGPDITGHEIKLNPNKTTTNTTGTDSEGESDREWGESVFGGVVGGDGAPQVVIESWHRARMDRNIGDVAPDVPGDVWDVTVVDEAHSASANGPNDTTKLYDLLGAVENTSKCLYALTATPMELAIGDLHDLLRLCDLPDSWDTKQAFTEFFETRKHLQDIIRHLTIDTTKQKGHREVLTRLRTELGLQDGEARQRVSEFGEMLMEHFQERDGYHGRAESVLESVSMESIQQRKAMEKLLGVRETRRTDTARSLMFTCNIEQWGVLASVTDWGSPVQSRIFRNNRSILEKCEALGLDMGNIPERDVETKRIKLGSDVQPIYDDIEQYITETYKKSQELLTGREKHALGFVMTLYQQRLTSSINAIQESLTRRQNTITEKEAELTEKLSALSEDDAVTEATVNEVIGQANIDSYTPSGGEAINIIQSEQQALNDLVSKLEGLTSDPKLKQLQDDIRAFERTGRDNIIIFTQYEDTLTYIRDALVQTHNEVGTYSGNGGKQYDAETDSWVEVGKEVITRQFTDGDVRFLVCTDSASEGLNLQTADALINYDLPWNPMRVEQRIGRIDRIGQENDVVKVINYAYEDSVDGDIYEQLEQRLNLFEDVVGKMRPVLSNLEGDIRSAAMDTEETSDGVDDVVSTAEAKGEQAQQKVEATGLTVTDDTATREEIIDEAGINGWDERANGLQEIGKRDEETGFEPVITPTVVERLVTESDVLREHGWVFESIRNHDEIDTYESVSEDVYVLEPPANRDNSGLVGDVGAGAAQTILRDEGRVAVTFNPNVAAAYTSLRLLLPGDPVYDDILDVLSGGESRVKFVCGDNSSVSVEDTVRDVGECDVVVPAVCGDSINSIGDTEVLDVEKAKSEIKQYLR